MGSVLFAYVCFYVLRKLQNFDTAKDCAATHSILLIWASNLRYQPFRPLGMFLTVFTMKFHISVILLQV